MGKSFRDRRGYDRERVESSRKADISKCTIFVSLNEVFISQAQVDKLLARDGQQIESYRQAYENGEEMVRVVLRPRFDGGYNVEDGRHRVIAAKQAGVGCIEAIIIGA